MNTSVYCSQGGNQSGAGSNPAIDPRGAQRMPEPDGSKRPDGQVVNPNTYYGYGSPSPAPQSSEASPAASSPGASSQNANQNTAFPGVSSSPADALADSGRGAPPIVIPGLG
jgi:hypothetical protein